MSAAPPVECEMLHPTLFVADLNAAVAFYTEKLGFALGFTWGDPPRMAGVDLGKVSIHLAQGTPNPAGCELFFAVGEVDELHAFHLAAGVTIVDPLADRPWGFRQYEVQDLSGHRLSFGQRLPETEPTLEIERVDVPVRLERRLAAVLADLAGHKRMSVSACLEETLLHTFEKLAGGGVPSPHGDRTLDLIQTFKAKHGLDYETHASYRFVEKP
jgi:catechol 2,3-dioxygenase-like lactoylglutathione lyase family enzyme